MKAWEEVQVEPLAFPIRGKVYTVPELGYQAWLTIQKIRRGEDTPLDGQDADQTWSLVLGPVWAEMQADDVPIEAMSRAGLAALADIELGRETAEQVWESGLDPKAVAEGILARAQRMSPSTSTSTESASGTRSPASTSRTTSRKGSSKKTAQRVRSRS